MSLALMSAVQADPTHIGFIDIKDPCLTTPICADLDHTFFRDTFHPALFGHAFFAVTLETALSQPDNLTKAGKADEIHTRAIGRPKMSRTAI